MKNFFYLLLLTIVFVSCGQDDTVIFNELESECNLLTSDCDFEAPLYEDLSGTELRAQLLECYSPCNTFSYTIARRYLYSEVDVVNGQVNTIYSKETRSVNPQGTQSFIQAALEQNINCEHVYPQSLGADEEPARADMYHIYPELEYVNSTRSNLPFGNIADNDANIWYLEDQSSTATPSNPENWARANSNFFEPSDDRKGDVARSVFYFYLIYNDVADQAFFESMRETLLQWNEDDPVDQYERTRRNKVQSFQGNDNPFITDEDLAQRLYGN